MRAVHWIMVGALGGWLIFAGTFLTLAMVDFRAIERQEIEYDVRLERLKGKHLLTPREFAQELPEIETRPRLKVARRRITTRLRWWGVMLPVGCAVLLIGIFFADWTMRPRSRQSRA